MSIKAYGFNQPVVCDQDNVICVGHTRWLAAKKLEINKIPVYKRNFTRASFIAYNIADNKTGEFSDWDTGSLADLFLEIEDEEYLKSNTGFEQSEIDQILGIGQEGEREVEVEGHTRQIGDGTKKHVKIVQIFLDDVTFPKFIEMCEGLQAFHGNSDLTDTIYSSVERAYEDLKK